VVLLIKEDVNGIFFSMDITLGLIPLIILILTVANTNIDYTDSYLEKQYFQKAQDTAELMSTYTEHDDQTIFQKVSNALSEIVSNGDIKKAKNVGVAVKCYGNYLFKLYVWQ